MGFHFFMNAWPWESVDWKSYTLPVDVRANVFVMDQSEHFIFDRMSFGPSICSLP